MMADNEPVAVIMIAHDGPIGEVICKESARSFCELSQVSGFYLADLASGRAPREALAKCVPSSLGDKLRHVEVIQAARRGGAAAAYKKLVKLAERDGYRFVVLARSHERLVNRKTKAMCDSLPKGWSSADVLQAVSNVLHRPQVDMVFRTSLFTLAGAVLAAPVPHSQLVANQLSALPLPDFAVMVEEEKKSISAALADLSEATLELSAAPSDSFVKSYLEHQLVLAMHTARLCDEASARLDKRVAEGPNKGWAGVDGFYFACFQRLFWRAEASHGVSNKSGAVSGAAFADLLLAANTGLAFATPRMEGVLALASALRRSDMYYLSGLLVSAALGAAPAQPLATWMGNPAVLDVGLHEEACASAFLMEEGIPQASAAAHMHALCALGSDTGKFSTSVQQKYVHVKDQNDGHPARALFPRLCDLCLPDFMVFSNVVKTPHKLLDMFGTSASCPAGAGTGAGAGADWEEGRAIPIKPCQWLLRFIQSLLHVPVTLSWECMPHVIQGRMPSVFVSLGPGYSVFVPVALDPAVKATLRNMKHLGTGHESVPDDPAVAAQLHTDAPNISLWEPVMSVPLTLGSVVVLRSRHYFVIEAGYASILFAEVKF